VSELNGAAERPRAIPTSILAIAIIVAVGAVSALLYVLFQETEGPGPTLRRFAEQVRSDVEAGEGCARSYTLIDTRVRASLAEEDWCRALPHAAERLDPGFSVQQMLLRGRVAELTIRSRLATTSEVWLLRKVDDAWVVVGPEGGFEELLAA